MAGDIITMVLAASVLALLLSSAFLLTANLRARAPPARDPRLEFAADEEAWRRLLAAARTGSWRRGAVVALVVGMAVGLAARPGGWPAALAGALAFGAANFTLGVVWHGVGAVRPPRYVLTREHLVTTGWVLFFPPPLDRKLQLRLGAGAWPWPRLGPYWWEDRVLSVRLKGGFGASGVVKLAVPPGQQRPVQACLRAQGLKAAPDPGPGRRSPERGRRRKARKKSG